MQEDQGGLVSLTLLPEKLKRKRDICDREKLDFLSNNSSKVFYLYTSFKDLGSYTLILYIFSGFSHVKS